jgi:hypothetical protein
MANGLSPGAAERQIHKVSMLGTALLHHQNEIPQINYYFPRLLVITIGNIANSQEHKVAIL